VNTQLIKTFSLTFFSTLFISILYFHFLSTIKENQVYNFLIEFGLVDLVILLPWTFGVVLHLLYLLFVAKRINLSESIILDFALYQLINFGFLLGSVISIAIDDYSRGVYFRFGRIDFILFAIAYSYLLLSSLIFLGIHKKLKIRRNLTTENNNLLD